MWHCTVLTQRLILIQCPSQPSELMSVVMSVMSDYLAQTIFDKADMLLILFSYFLRAVSQITWVTLGWWDWAEDERDVAGAFYSTMSEDDIAVGSGQRNNPLPTHTLDYNHACTFLSVVLNGFYRFYFALWTNGFWNFFETALSIIIIIIFATWLLTFIQCTYVNGAQSN